MSIQNILQFKENDKKAIAFWGVLPYNISINVQKTKEEVSKWILEK